MTKGPLQGALQGALQMSHTWKESNEHHQGPLQMPPNWMIQLKSPEGALQISPSWKESNLYQQGPLQNAPHLNWIN